jgi:hypothetical protein
LSIPTITSSQGWVTNPSLPVNAKVAKPPISINLKVEIPFPLIQEWKVI